MEGYLAEIRLFAGNFAPQGWSLCEGQLLSVESNPALFSLLGATYGGDGRNNFALPDLRGSVPVQPNRTQREGYKTQGGSASSGDQVNVPGTLALNYIICVQGQYPARD